MQLVNISLNLKKEYLNQIRKRLYDIEKKTSINRDEKSKLFKELSDITTNIKYKRKYISNDYRDNNYINLQDIEYFFNSLDDYYKSILAQQVFNKNYQRYYIRGDKTRQLSWDTYLDKVKRYVKNLIDESKISEQKLQLVISINFIHITDKQRISHFTKSDNIKCSPSSNTDHILNKLLKSLEEKYQEDIKLCHTSSSFIYESDEELNIHFHKINLQCSASYILTPNWIKNKKGAINPKNNDIYCFIYAIDDD